MDRKLELPYKAEIFIKSKFLKAEIVELEKTDNIFKVELDNEIFITFDEDGNWLSINSEKRLPEHIIPEVVKEKIDKLKRLEIEYKNENLDINEIRRIINSYRVILDHYLEMHIYSR
ncbi:PepSY-like domain-containing protein [Brachyspira innocens]|uniref:PepSY-like domain-containing protein n=1 Tax=Brachyspira innocens TaxID=13264 RepID=A0ABT8Z084_9SPIR|nr:PepSY-like domain-containing protein [Brachyspira innocens]MDO6992872.1 PepSY-like domain-containing protein [Brachyspira innocens]MDO7020570.1 PepSY-like domain-containing protein [Brachyspira innocens]